MDPVFPSIDLARPQSLPGPQTDVPRVQSRNALLFERQNGVTLPRVAQHSPFFAKLKNPKVQ
jgi:hypothetical protein